VAGPRGLTRLVGRVQFTLHLWTLPPSNMPKEVLEAFSLTANCVFAVMEERKHALFRARIRGFKSHPRRLLTHQPRRLPPGEEIVSFGFWMHKQGRRNSTVRHCTKAPESTAKRARLLYPEYVKTYVASTDVRHERPGSSKTRQGSMNTIIELNSR
jgi:hypothetical protein